MTDTVRKHVASTQSLEQSTSLQALLNIEIIEKAVQQCIRLQQILETFLPSQDNLVHSLS